MKLHVSNLNSLCLATSYTREDQLHLVAQGDAACRLRGEQNPHVIAVTVQTRDEDEEILQRYKSKPLSLYLSVARVKFLTSDWML